MKKYSIIKKREAIEIIRKGGIGVLPTDTIYGLVGKAINKKTVERIYKIKGRDFKKPCILIISKISDINYFGIEINSQDREILEKIWPGKISVIFPYRGKKFFYLDRGVNGISFRLPGKKYLRDLVSKTGPLIAPSANPQGFPPAKNISEAKKYFNDKVDFYFRRGNLVSKPSTLIKLEKGKIKIIRKGADFKKISFIKNGKK